MGNLINYIGCISINIDKIMEGIKNNIIKKEHVEEIADIRWLDCSTCEHLDVKGKDLCYAWNKTLLWKMWL